MWRWDGRQLNQQLLLTRACQRLQSQTRPLGWAIVMGLLAVTAHAIPPGGSSSDPNCGLVCETKTSITLEVPASILEPQAVAISYAVTNKSLNTITGVVTLTVTGQAANLVNTSAPITLAPGGSYLGTVAVGSSAAGSAYVVADFRTPLQCTYVYPEGRHCTPGRFLGNAVSGIVVSADQDHDGLADDVEHSLLGLYAPLMLYANDHGGDEPYRPIDVLDYIRDSTLVSQVPGATSLTNTHLQSPNTILDPDPNVKNAAQISASQDPTTLPKRWLLSPSSQGKTGADWNVVLTDRHVGLYGHVLRVAPAQVGDPVLASELSTKFGGNKWIYKIEYWQFYGYSHDYQAPWYSNFIGFWIPLLFGNIADHDGDWCSVQLYIDPDVSSPDAAILAIYHYAHGLQFRFDLSKLVQTSKVNNPVYNIRQLEGPNRDKGVDLQLHAKNTDGAALNAQDNLVQLAMDPTSQLFVHPVVYVEWGGHEFWPSTGWRYYGAGKHNGTGKAYFAATPPNVGEVGQPMPGVPAASVVVQFAGFWGYFGPENNPGPGPTLHQEWLWNPLSGVDPVSARPNSLPF